MAQIFRIYKLDVPVLIRYYGNYNHSQRSKGNYYDILNISQDATQKEIKDAFIKMSKKMHPDSGKDGSHADFVRINEAYSTLSKRNKKRDYDMSLKYNYTYTESPPYPDGRSRKGPYKTYTDWGFVDPNDYRQHKSADIRRSVMGSIALIIIGTFIQLTFIHNIMHRNRHSMLEKQARYQAEYERIKEEARHRTLHEQIQNFNDKYENFQFKWSDK
nr:dnaJ-like protein 60 isoform X1 [Megalopta genalis]